MTIIVANFRQEEATDRPANVLLFLKKVIASKNSILKEKEYL